MLCLIIAHMWCSSSLPPSPTSQRRWVQCKMASRTMTVTPLWGGFLFVYCIIIYWLETQPAATDDDGDSRCHHITTPTCTTITTTTTRCHHHHHTLSHHITTMTTTSRRRHPHMHHNDESWLALLLTIYWPLSTGHCAQYQWFYYNAIVIDCNWL